MIFVFSKIVVFVKIPDIEIMKTTEICWIHKCDISLKWSPKLIAFSFWGLSLQFRVIVQQLWFPQKDMSIKSLVLLYVM